MSSPQETPKVCPVCRIAMQAERLDAGVQHICERCGLTISIGPLGHAVSKKEEPSAIAPSFWRGPLIGRDFGLPRINSAEAPVFHNLKPYSADLCQSGFLLRCAPTCLSLEGSDMQRKAAQREAQRLLNDGLQLVVIVAELLR